MDRVMLNWQPMETAPKDGNAIMVYAEGAQLPAIVFWSAQYNQWIDIEYEDLDTAFIVCGGDWVLRGGNGAWKPLGWAPCPDFPGRVE